MKWVTRQNVMVDRVASSWLIRKFVDREAEFLFVPGDKVQEVAKTEKATPFDAPGAELHHRQGKSTFEAILETYQIDDPAAHLLAKIVHGATMAEDRYGRPEAPGLKAVAQGFHYIGFKDDSEILAHQLIVYHALYAYCQQEVEKEEG
ncbi:MAG: chromate resistance protein [Planctomycetes bacterium DG_23]|nr:MAG: chromate resistance protein [Planctomycetes bacterium DG_23]